MTTNTTEFNAGVRLMVNTSNDEVKLNQTMGGSAGIYCLAGDQPGGASSKYFQRYDISGNTWALMNSTPVDQGAGGALTYDGNYIYAFAGDNTNTFMRYTISSDTWTLLNSTPVPINYGGALAYGGGQYIYALAGGQTNTFLRYNIITDTWNTNSSTPATIGAGGSLAWYRNTTFLYALRGDDDTGTGGGSTKDGTKTFWMYNITNDTWVQKADIPDFAEEGAALAYGGGGTFYATNGGIGGGSAGFFGYNVTTNTWTTQASTPQPIKQGGALTSDETTYVYAIRGGNQAFFDRYSISGNSWTGMANTLAQIGWGGSLIYVPGTGYSCYTSPGSIASIVFDTQTNGSRWDVLAWNATIPTGTNITFEVRASDTLFLKDAGSPSWISVTGTLIGGTYYVYYPALPIGRYLQWRANLTSTVCANTPVLYDVTVYYTDP